jgi:acetyl-CoA synthetase
MRYGEEHARSSDLSRRERVCCAGEVRNAPAWAWLQHDLLHGRGPVIDHMWQAETGGPVFGNPIRIKLRGDHMKTAQNSPIYLLKQVSS